jgi:pimeloyl-ACP methyl ester carboxylesterase
VFDPFRVFSPLTPRYGRKPILILMNGLAEQGESWYRNIPAWRRRFEVHTPNIMAYSGDRLHSRIDAGEPISIEYIVEQLHHYVCHYVQSPPYHFAGSSTGGKIVAEFAVKYPDLVNRVVLFGPSGVSDVERLPVVQGVRRHDTSALVNSVFHNPRKADPRLASYYKTAFADRRWRTGFIKTVRGTLNHSIRQTLPKLHHPTLMIVGLNDQIVDPQQAIEAGRTLPQGRLVELPKCGHAPHLESWRKVNKLVIKFLQEAAPAK